jgi:hypothetical protein
MADPTTSIHFLLFRLLGEIVLILIGIEIITIVKSATIIPIVEFAKNKLLIPIILIVIKHMMANQMKRSGLLRPLI